MYRNVYYTNRVNKPLSGITNPNGAHNDSFKTNSGGDLA